MSPNKKIRRLRKQLGLLQVDLAKRCGLSIAQLRRIENGKVDAQSMPGTAVRSLATCLGVDVDYLRGPRHACPWGGTDTAPGLDPESGKGDGFMDVSAEEKAFLETMRQSSATKRELASDILSAPMDAVRIAR